MTNKAADLTPAGRDMIGPGPGVLHGRLRDEGRAVNAQPTTADRRDGVPIDNALRGLTPARLG